MSVLYNAKNINAVAQMSRQDILEILDLGVAMIPYYLRNVNVPNVFGMTYPGQRTPGFADIMFEPSTGTQNSFEHAASLLGMSQVKGIADVSKSSIAKGERISHLIRRLYACGIRFFAIRGKIEGLTTALSYDFDQRRAGHLALKNDVSFINAGEGEEYHPTQPILDALGIVTWELFSEALIADGAFRIGRPNFLAAVEQFCVQEKEERLARIAAEMDNLTMCFGGDMTKSRVLSDWLSMGEKGKFTIHYILVAPDFAQLDGRYLQNISHNTTTDFHPNLPAKYFYRLRWQKERWDKHFHEEIARCDRQYRITVAFCEALARRKKTDKCPGPGFVLDALPIDKINPAIEFDAEDHPSVLCWHQMSMATPARMAVIANCYRHWRDEESAERYCWRLPDQSPLVLTNLREPVNLSAHQRDYREHGGGKGDRVNLVDDGSNLDHVPADMGTFVKRLVRAAGYDGNIIISDRVHPRKHPDAVKDIMWFPGMKLHERYPEILAAVDFMMQGMFPDKPLTYNVFDAAEDVKRKMIVDQARTTSVLRTLRCPRGVLPPGETDGSRCIEGLRDSEVKVVSIFDFIGTGDGRMCRDAYCNGLFTPAEMLERMLKSF